MATFPEAIVKLIPHGSEDPPIVPCGLVYHVRDGLGLSLFDDFTDGRGIESHFYIRFTGEIEQYRDTGTQADAQLDGNSFVRDGRVVGFLSVETEGRGAGLWTEAQLATLKKLSRWVHEQFDVPLRVCPEFNSPGYGYHTMFGAPSHWTPVVKTCPGPDRIKQFNEIIVPWLEAGAPEEEPDMQLTDAIGKHTDTTVGDVLRRLDAYLTRTVPAMRERMQKIRADIDALPEGASAAEVRQIVHHALDGLEATIQEALDHDREPVPVVGVQDDEG
jgi:hypothetical protein